MVWCACGDKDVIEVVDISVEEGTLDEFKVSRRENGLAISHLQFADDTIFFRGATMENALALKNILISFKMISGLSINL